MTWHVHLAPEVALDLRDGRTVAVATPAPSHEWQVPGGRTVAVSEGDPVPAPGSETVSVRVTGPYLVVSASQEGGGSPLLVARVVQAAGDDLPQPRAEVDRSSGGAGGAPRGDRADDRVADERFAARGRLPDRVVDGPRADLADDQALTAWKHA